MTLSTRRFIAALLLASFPACAAKSPPVVRSELSLRSEYAGFSPNEDEDRDQLFLSPVFSGPPVEVRRWRLEVRGRGQWRPAHVAEGASMPALIRWDGRDGRGRLVDDGAYIARLTAWTPGRPMAAETGFTVDRRSPRIELGVSESSSSAAALMTAPFVFTPIVHDASPIERWQFQVMDIRGRIVCLFWADGAVRPVQWDGKDQNSGAWAPAGLYRCAYQVWDAAGNPSEPVFVDVTLVAGAADALEGRLRRIRLERGAEGLRVELDARRLFSGTGGRPVLSDAGHDIVRELTLLINAHPLDVVRISGSAATDDLASRYVWALYDALVRTGSVNPAVFRMLERSSRRAPDGVRVELVAPE